MRYYIEAWRSEEEPLLGNLEGQASLGDVVNPYKTMAWKHVKSLSRTRSYPRVHHWRLVTETGRVVATVLNPKHNQEAELKAKQGKFSL